tara:strand:+ start:3412 stop:3717 length:306 start_codon:yes stop_codon:yes gene_type:complete
LDYRKEIDFVLLSNLKMNKEENDLYQIYEKLQDEDTNDLKKWNEAIIPKIILLFPLLIFLLTFLSINNEKSIIDLIMFILFGFVLVSFGLLLSTFISYKQK